MRDLGRRKPADADAAPWPAWAAIVDARFVDLDAFDDDGRQIKPFPLTGQPWGLAAAEGGEA